MTALDVLSLDYVKESILEVDFPDKDDFIENLIKSAVVWVEKYTGYSLYQREQNFQVWVNSQNLFGGKRSISVFPFEIIDVKNYKGETLNLNQGYSIEQGPLKIYICAPVKSVIRANVGYSIGNKGEIPQPLLDAACKLIVYLFENHGSYSAGIPSDIQILINQFRRDPTI